VDTVISIIYIAVILLFVFALLWERKRTSQDEEKLAKSFGSLNESIDKLGETVGRLDVKARKATAKQTSPECDQLSSVAFRSDAYDLLCHALRKGEEDVSQCSLFTWDVRSATSSVDWVAIASKIPSESGEAFLWRHEAKALDRWFFLVARCLFPARKVGYVSGEWIDNIGERTSLRRRLSGLSSVRM
jgi:hypothetical protein